MVYLRWFPLTIRFNSDYRASFHSITILSPIAQRTLLGHTSHTFGHNSLLELDLLWKGAAIQKKVPVIPGNLASVGFGFNQEDCFIRTDDNTCPVVVMGQRDEDG